MTPLALGLIIGLSIVALLIFILVQIDTDEEDLGTSIRRIQDIDSERQRRLRSLTKAYDLAKEELGEEPTFDQIILTRDSMEDISGTS